MYYCATVTMAGPTTYTSGTVEVIVSSAFTAHLSPLTVTIDAGQSVTFTASAAGGTPGYQYHWYNGTGFCTVGVGTFLIPGATGTMYTVPAHDTTAVGLLVYSVYVNDSAATPLSHCLSALVTVHHALGATLILSSNHIDTGLPAVTVTATLTITPGTPRYGATLYSGTTATGCATNIVAVTGTPLNPDKPITAVSVPWTFPSPSTTTFYCAKVIDSPLGNTTVTTTAALFTVEPVVSVSFWLNESTVYPGRWDVMANATAAGGSPVGLGTATFSYTYTFYSGSSPTCTSDTVVIHGPALQGNISDTLNKAVYSFAKPLSPTYYCAKAVDSEGQAAYSTALPITITTSPPPPTAFTTPFLSLSQKILDNGQTATITATVTWLGGTGPFTVYLYNCHTSCAVRVVQPVIGFSNPQTGLTLQTNGNGTATFTFPVTLTVTNYWQADVIDTHSVTTLTSIARAITVPVAAFTAPHITSDSFFIASGQGVTLTTTIAFMGGTSPYLCQWYQESPSMTSYVVLGASYPCTTPTPLPSTLSGLLFLVGYWNFKLSVTDTSGIPVTVSSNVVSVLVTFGPQGTATDTYNGMSSVYVANTGFGNVKVIDSLSNTVDATITVGNEPVGIAVGLANSTKPDGFVFVSNTYDGTVSVIDASTNLVVQTVTVGTNPVGIAINNALHQVYVANEGSNTISVINATRINSHISVYENLPSGLEPANVAVSSTGIVFVTDYGSAQVTVLQHYSTILTQPWLPINYLFSDINVAGGSGPWGIAVNAGSVYVTDITTNGVYVMSATSPFGEIGSLITVGAAPTSIAINAATSTAYVVNYGGLGSVSTINLATNAVGTVSVGAFWIGPSPWAIALLTSTSNLGYVVNNLGSSVSVVSLATNTVIDVIPLS
jgi:YVTN family beta-propeller protein